MKRRFVIPMILMLALASANIANAKEGYPTTTIQEKNAEITYGQQASVTFSNNSEYTMTVRILYSTGGYYNTVYLNPHSSRTVYFDRSNSFKMKIKAVHGGQTSYHDGGRFSVTNNGYEYSQGSISFSMSTYGSGSGLGPKISAKEFESNN